MGNDNDSREPLSTLHTVGLRATRSRTAILRVLREATAPLSHSEVLAVLAAKYRLRHTTAYRTLQSLVAAGIARRMDVGDRIWRFELAGIKSARSGQVGARFVCESCGRVFALPANSVRVRPSLEAPRCLFEGAFETQVRGVCDACRPSDAAT